MDAHALPDKQRPLDPVNPDHRVVLDELAAMSVWSGVKFSILNNADGDVRAEPNNVILLDFEEVRECFGCLAASTFRTAVILALGHELGHLIQYAMLGYENAVARDPKLCEAQADLFAGAWLGLRIGSGAVHTVQAVSRFGLRLVTPESHAHLYPDAETRDGLLLKGLSMGAMLNDASRRTGIELKGVITRTDFDDLWVIAERIASGAIL
jgi:hypothetical protein